MRRGRRKGSRHGRALAALSKMVPPLPVERTRTHIAEQGAAAPNAQRNAGDRPAQDLPKPAMAAVRTGSLVKLRSSDKKFDGQVGRVVDTNVKFEHTAAGMVSVLLAPKGHAQGVWVAVPPDCLTAIG